MDNENKNQIYINEIKEELVLKLQLYIKAILDRYGNYIPLRRKEMLENINDYSKHINIYDYGSINGFANYSEISMPLCADRILKSISKVPGFGIYKNHKTYNEKNLVINSNTFMKYIIHVFISGTDAKGYYEDLLLHEAMHFCGSGGSSALDEGFNELLTRKLALENNFRTSGCGYPKEVQVVYELQQIFGEEIVEQLAFIDNFWAKQKYLKEELGEEAVILYTNIYTEMENEFQNKYYKNIDSYNGIFGILKKNSDYKKIDYSKIYKLLEEYKIKNKIGYIESNKRK